MNLTGDYATVLTKVENHHNFAWKEVWKGQEIIVHRKGATPAEKGVMEIIPASMTAPGFLVRGKGDIDSIHSAYFISKENQRFILTYN